MKKLSLPALAFVVLGITTQAFADWTSPPTTRCMADALTNDQARGRQQWAQRCRQQNPYSYPAGVDQRFWHSMFTADAYEAAEYGIYVYPVYMDSTTNMPWLGPGAAGSSTAGYTGEQIANLALHHQASACLPGRPV